MVAFILNIAGQMLCDKEVLFISPTIINCKTQKQYLSN
jgi:hypothetical protein